MWERGIEPPTHTRDGTQTKESVGQKQESAQRVEGCKNSAGLFTVPKSTKSHTKEYSLSASCYKTNARPFPLTMAPH